MGYEFVFRSCYCFNTSKPDFKIRSLPLSSGIISPMAKNQLSNFSKNKLLCSYSGRAPEAATAVGSKSQHVKQQRKLFDDAFRKL